MSETTKLKHVGKIQITVRDKGRRPGEPGRVVFETKDTNTILPYFEYNCFNGPLAGVGTVPDFNDGTNTYVASAANALAGFWIASVAGAVPSGLDSFMDFTPDFNFFLDTTYQVDNIAHFQPTTVTKTVTVDSLTQMSVITNSSANAVDVAQFGFMPSLLQTGDSPPCLVLPLSGTTFGPFAPASTGTFAISTIYTLSSPASVPAGGAITIQYEISATY